MGVDVGSSSSSQCTGFREHGSKEVLLVAIRASGGSGLGAEGLLSLGDLDLDSVNLDIQELAIGSLETSLVCLESVLSGTRGGVVVVGQRVHD